MESKNATTTSASAATDGIQHYETTHDATTDDATTDDSDSTTATDGIKRDAYAPNAIWSTVTETTVENDVTVRGGGMHVVNNNIRKMLVHTYM